MQLYSQTGCGQICPAGHNLLPAAPKEQVTRAKSTDFEGTELSGRDSLLRQTHCITVQWLHKNILFYLQIFTY